MNDDHALTSDPLALAVFEKLRRTGIDATDGKTIESEGNEYALTALSICKFEIVHVVAKTTKGRGAGFQRAMVVTGIKKHGFRGVDGAAYLLQSLIDGVVIKDKQRPEFNSWRVLPVVQVPDCYLNECSDEESENK